MLKPPIEQNETASKERRAPIRSGPSVNILMMETAFASAMRMNRNPRKKRRVGVISVWLCGCVEAYVCWGDVCLHTKHILCV